MAEKKDYLRRYQMHRREARPFRNPYFTRQSKPERHWKSYAIGAGVAAVICLCIYLIGFIPLWTIQGVRVDGLQFMSGAEIKQLAEDQLARRRFLIFPQSNRLFYDQDKLTGLIGEKYSFETLDVSIEQSVVVITVKERISQLLWRSDAYVYYVDESGTVIRSLPPEELGYFTYRGLPTPLLGDEPLLGPFPLLLYLNSLPLIIDDTKADVEVGKKVLKDGDVRSVLAFDRAMRERGVVITRSEAERSAGPWVRAYTNEGFYILYDTKQDVEEQIGNTLTVLQNEISDRSALEYIDVRFGSHVYYKLR